MKNRYTEMPILRSTFSLIAAASSRSRSLLIPFRLAQRNANAAHHDPMAYARKAYMCQRYMSLCYIPSHF